MESIQGGDWEGKRKGKLWSPETEYMREEFLKGKLSHSKNVVSSLEK